MDCPKCAPSLLDRVAFTVPDRSVPGPAPVFMELAVDQCVLCGGVWFDSGELDRFLDAKLELAGPNSPSGTQKPDKAAASCPRCGLALEKAPAPNNPKVTADLCRACGGLWLDGGELARVAGQGAPLSDRLKAFFAQS